MKRNLLTLVFSLSLTFAFSQAVPDASFTDCNNNTRTIYQALATGKVLVVANAGTNCSICMSHANGVATLANNNPNTMEVWGSMTTKSGGNPGCGALNSWVNTYSWTNVFTFLDSNKYWFVAATPRYTVIDPSDSTIAYAGSSWTTAQNTATQLANSIGVEEESVIRNISVLPTSISVSANEVVKTGEAQLYDLTGKQIESWNLPVGVSSFVLDFNASKTSGLYLLRIKMNGNEIVERIFY